MKYYVQTLGCQMNAHDSERIAGMLESMRYTKGTEDDLKNSKIDVIAINTCAVRENASNKLYGHLGMLAETKRNNPNLRIIVGGCLAQKDREEMKKKAPWVDVIFGTHNIAELPELLQNAIETNEPQVSIAPVLQSFASTLPASRVAPHSAWVSISVGCNNACTFCIVPQLRGKERDRRPGEILAEIDDLISKGVSEITLLGQNVNSYGAEFGDRGAFGKLLRACGDFEERGLKRVRFTSPHPAAFTDDVIAAMAETSNVMPSIHMPLQSGSDKVLRIMRRSYRSAHFLDIIKRVRAAIPDVSITTDIIVGMPGETEEDFQETMKVMRECNFTAAYTFQYSIRPNTPAATMPDQIPRDIVQDRFERLLKMQNDITYEGMKKFEGQTLEVMISAEVHRKDSATKAIPARTRDNRLVHIDYTPELEKLTPGDIIQVKITHAAPFHLLAEAV